MPRCRGSGEGIDAFEVRVVDMIRDEGVVTGLLTGRR